jgi:NAD(P)-dependent dehydrogenase (short-subunit alcohol dehydrogenase family)
MQLQGKVAIVTGAARGIGKATALRFAREGARVVVGYRAGKDRAESTVKEIEALGAQAFAHGGDLSTKAACDALVAETVRRFGRVDVMVNNAGENRAKPFLDIPESDVMDLMAINYASQFFMTQAVARQMLAQEPKGGRIVNVGSIAGVLARPGSVAYGAAKAAVHSLTMSTAEALAPHVTVNAVAPGMVDTELNAYQKPEFRASVIHQTPMKRYGSVDEIAEAILFFAAGPAFATGQVLVIDGGIGNIYFRT